MYLLSVLIGFFSYFDENKLKNFSVLIGFLSYFDENKFKNKQ